MLQVGYTNRVLSGPPSWSTRDICGLSSGGRPVDERYLMREERKRRRKQAREARMLSVGRFACTLTLLLCFVQRPKRLALLAFSVCHGCVLVSGFPCQLGTRAADDASSPSSYFHRFFVPFPFLALVLNRFGLDRQWQRHEWERNIPTIPTLPVTLL